MKPFLVVILMLTLSFTSVQGQDRYETLEVGPIVYEDVQVLSKTDTDLFIKHSRGACNLKVSDLSNELRVSLGYPPLAEVKPKGLSSIEVDPRVQEMNVKLIEEVEGMVSSVAPAIVFGVLGGFTLLYLFGCYCMKLICDKAGSKPSILVWLPFLKWFPLFRAARMSGWAVLPLVAPLVFIEVALLKLPPDLSPSSPQAMVFLGLAALSFLLPAITMIVWSIKICKARGKSGLVAFLLIFPMTNLFAFLYLAFSGTGEEDEGNPGFVTFS